MQDVKNDTVRNSLWLNGLSAVFLMIMLLFVPPVTAVHAAEESQWTYSEESRLWFYTDQNGWKYAMSSKDADSYELWSIPEETTGEIVISTETDIDGKARKLSELAEGVFEIPTGVTKVTFEKGIRYWDGALFGSDHQNLTVCGYLENSKSSVMEYARKRHLKMEYLNGYVDENGVIYYIKQLPAEDGTTENVTGAVYGYEGKAKDITIKSEVTIKGTAYPVTCIDNMAFMDDIYVKKVTLPDTITTLEYNAFFWAKSLTSVKLSKNLTTIGSSAFKECINLTSIEIPSGVKKIDYSTFYHCRSLKQITLPKNIKSIGNQAFQNCILLKNVTIQSREIDSIGEMAFAGDTKLKNITIKAENLTSKKLSKNIWKDTAKKMVVKVPAKKVNTYKKLLKKYGNSTIVVKKL